MDFLANPLHLTLLIVVIVLLFGASKLGDVGGALGKSIREFKKEASTDDGRPRPQMPPPTSGYVSPAPTSYNSQQPAVPPVGYVPQNGRAPVETPRVPEYTPGDYRPSAPVQPAPPASGSVPPDFSAR